jgi:biofilm PGA synthesis protein PgaA
MRAQPRNKHVRQLVRDLDIKDMRLLTVDAAYTTEDPGATSFEWSTRVDQPVYPDRKVFGEYIWNREKQDDTVNLRRRWRGGVDWRLDRDWWAVAALSVDEHGDDFGHDERLTYNPNDYWWFSGWYDSYSLDIPLRASVTGVDGDETGISMRYRASEEFIADASAVYRDLSDDNDQTVYSLRLDRALTTAAYWKTRVAFEGSASVNSRQDVEYFSPDRLYDFYIIPMVEHTWFRRYERAWVDRLYVAPGVQWQSDFGWNDVWYVRYEQDHRFSDLTALLAGVTFSRKNYDDEDANVWTIYATLKQRF